MPSRADISFLLLLETIILFRMKACQCPLGLIHHFYLLQVINVQLSIGVSMPSRAYTSFLLHVTIPRSNGYKLECQCPLGLIPHFYIMNPNGKYLIVEIVSMPSRAYTSFLPSKAGIIYEV